MSRIRRRDGTARCLSRPPDYTARRPVDLRKHTKKGPEMTEIVLPERGDMLTRLKSVIDEPRTVSGFYPLLLEHAGLEKTPEGVGLMFVLAVADYAGQIPASQMTLSVALARFVAGVEEGGGAGGEPRVFWRAGKQHSGRGYAHPPRRPPRSP